MMNYKTFFTPGPSQMYFTVEDHLKTAFKENIPSISHRSNAFSDIFKNTRESLKNLLSVPDGYEIYFTSSANEIWERIIQNLVQNKSHHFVNGAFSEKFYNFAISYQKASSITRAGEGLEFENLSVPDNTELISITLNETSTGYAFDQNNIKQLRADHPDKIIALDGVSAFPAVPINLELVDTAYFSVQKCFGLPAGLGVWVVNKKCLNHYEKVKGSGLVTGSYHDLAQLKSAGDKNQTPETPNILSIYLLGKVAEDMINRPVKMIQSETAYKAAILYQAIENSKSLTPFVKQKVNRSKTVVVAETKNGNTEILDTLKTKGWIMGKGYGAYKEDHIRIANFPAVSKEQMEQVADFISTL